MGLDVSFQKKGGEEVSWEWAYAHGFPFSPVTIEFPPLYDEDGNLIEEERTFPRINEIFAMWASGDVSFRGGPYASFFGSAFHLDGENSPQQMQQMRHFLASSCTDSFLSEQQLQDFDRLLSWAIENKLTMIGG